MQSIFARAKRADIITACHDALLATGDAIKESKVKALKHLGGRILNDKTGHIKLREEWLEVYTSLCRYNEIDHSKLPNVNSLSYTEWCRVRAYETTRILAKEYKVHEDLLPLDFKPHCKLDAKFHTTENEAVSIGRGNMIIPHLTAKPPSVEIRSSELHAKPFYSLLLVDLDRPDTKSQMRFIYSHWLRVNVSGGNPAGDSVHKYEPACPERGSGVHRYVLVAVGHDQAVSIKPELSRESFNLLQFLASTNGTVQGLSFFRTVWTKQIEAIVPNMRVFGQVEEQYRGPPISRYSIH